MATCTGVPLVLGRVCKRCKASQIRDLSSIGHHFRLKSLPERHCYLSVALWRMMSPHCRDSTTSAKPQEHPDMVSGSRGGSDSRPAGYPWRVVAAVCVQRFPSLSRGRGEQEERYEELKDTLRMERSCLSDFELEEAEYLRKKREREKRALEEDLDESQVAKAEGSSEFEELQEAREAELEAFQPASRETEADRTNDCRSVERCLERVLYLLVKKPREEHAWQMPQGGLEEGESLLKAAKRELQKDCGSKMKVEFLSGAPVAFHSYKHSQTSPNGIIGSKVFFLKAQYRKGQVQMNSRKLQDYLWVTREEMRHHVSPDYYAAVSPILLG